MPSDRDTECLLAEVLLDAIVRSTGPGTFRKNCSEIGCVGDLKAAGCWE